MKTHFAFLFIFMNVLLFAQTKAEKQLLKSDESFAKLSRDKGVKTAFETYLATNTTTFSYKAGIITDRDKSIENFSKLKSLDWIPLKAEVSKSKDMGYTYGIGKATYEVNGKIETSYSYYVSIWKRDEKGNWKLSLDSGTDCSEEIGKKYFKDQKK